MYSEATYAKAKPTETWEFKAEEVLWQGQARRQVAWALKKESEIEVTQLCPTLRYCGLHVAHQAPPFMGFSRQEYWSELPFPFPGDLPNPGIEPRSPTLQADALTSKPLEKQQIV